MSDLNQEKDNYSSDDEDVWGESSGVSDQDSWHLDKEEDARPSTTPKTQLLITDFYKIIENNKGNFKK